MLRCKHIIWDWNGTLFEDSHLCREITARHMAQFGIPEISTEEHQRRFKHPVKEYYESIGFDWSQCSFEEIAQSFIQEYECRMSECAVREGASQVLLDLSEQGVTHSILSAVRHDILTQLVNSSGLAPYFMKWVGLTDDYAHSKVENGLGLLRELNLDKSDIILVGDTTHDAEAAQAMGVEVILVPSGYQHADILHDSGYPFLESFSQLKDMLQYMAVA